MSGTTKKLAIGLGIVAGVIVVGLVLLILFFPTDFIRDRAVAAMEERLQRQVQVGGARLTIFPSLGADLTEVRIGDQAEPGRPRIALASLRLRVRLLPLLQRKVEITSVEIERLELDVHLGERTSEASPPRGGPIGESRPSADGKSRDTAGTTERLPTGTSTTDRTQPLSEGSEDTAGAGSVSKAKRPLDLRINALTVSDGKVRVRSADGSPLVELAGIFEDLKAEGTSEGDLRLQGHTRVDSLRIHLPAGDLGQGMRLKLDKQLHYDRSSDSLTVEKADLDLNGLPVSILGKAGHVLSGHPTIDMKLKGGPGEVSDILGYLPSAMFPQVEGVKSTGIISLEASVQGPLAPEGKPSPDRKPDFQAAFTLSEGRIVHPRLPEPIDGVGLKASVTPQLIDITSFTAQSGTSRIKARAKVSSYDSNPTVDAALDIDVDLQEVAAMHLQPSSHEMNGRAVAQLSVRGPAKDPNRMKVAGIVDLRSVGFQNPGMKSPMEDLNGRILVHDKDLTLQELSVKMGSSDFSARGTLSNYTALQPGAGAEHPARIDLAVHSRLLALDELTSPSATEEEAQVGQEQAARATPGQAAVPPAGQAGALLAALTGKVEFSADRVRTKETETGLARALATVDRGLIRVERLDLEVFGGTLAAQGTVDYRSSQTPKFDLKAQVQKMRTSDLLASSKSVNRFSRMAGYLSGEVDANATLKGDLNEAQDLNLGTLTSIGDLTIHGAKINDHPLQVRLADYLETPQLKGITISDWFQPFRIENGRLIVENLSIKSERVTLSARGWQSLDGKVEMEFEILLPQELTEGIRKQIPKELVPILFDGTESQILVPLRVTGSYDSPRVAVDSDRLTAGARAQAQKKLAEERARLEEEAKRRAKGFLDGLIKTPSDTTSAKNKASDVEKKVKQSLKDLFKKKK